MHEHALSMCILQSLCPKADDQGKAWQFFLNLRIFKTVDRNYFLAKDWIRTMDLYYQIQHLCKLCFIHCTKYAKKSLSNKPII